jgi:predicted MFS family arabinose efflux permease
VKRSLLFETTGQTGLVAAGLGLIACTYGLVRLAYGLFLPDIQDSLAMSSALAGVVSSGASVAYCVGAVCGLVAADRSRVLVLGALLTASFGSIGMALAPGVALFIPSVILGSAGAGLASPGMVAMVERNISASSRDRAQAVVNSGTGPGLVVAGLLAVLLSPQWRLGFGIAAVLTAAVGIGVLLLDRPSEDGPAPRADPRRSSPSGWVRTLAKPATAAALLGTASAAVWTFGRSQLVAEGAGHTGSTLAWIALGVGGTATVVTSRSLSGLHPARAWLLTTAAVAGAIAVLGLAPDRLPAAVLACAVFGWGFVAATSALISWTSRLAPDRAASGTSLLFITLVLGQAAGSALAGGIAERHGMSSAFLLSAATALLAASFGWRVPNRRPAATSRRRWAG